MGRSKHGRPGMIKTLGERLGCLAQCCVLVRRGGDLHIVAFAVL